ncbi:MAG TPA: M43 family zinc metalloprotease [Saprospiraceae bacterium]|nr:M43 family zinc metalloprotease [Saprospiraceae bacterium]
MRDKWFILLFLLSALLINPTKSYIVDQSVFSNLDFAVCAGEIPDTHIELKHHSLPPYFIKSISELTDDKSLTSISSPIVYFIPVVINIVHDPSLSGDQSPYPSNAQILAGIDWINNLLAGSPACPGDPASVETGIRLCLASRDIGGQPTSGIVRLPNALTDLDLCTDDLALKKVPRVNADLFPNSDYLNLFIVREICASCQPVGCLAGAFATYPAGHGTLYDGIVIEAETWMNPDCDVRKLIIHELGHYFNLRHTWEGGCKNDNCLTDGDKVCDTPPDADENFYPSNPCLQSLPVNSCFTDVNPGDPNNPFTSDLPDQTSNFMDYAPPGCQFQFTPGQVARMTEALEGPRKSLLMSKGCEVPCQEPITLNLTWPVEPILFGNQFLIQNSSQGAVSYLWSWYNGPSVSVNLNFPADSIGSFEICITATGGNAECQKTECHQINVVCSLTDPTFQLSSTQIYLGETLQINQTSIPEPGFSYTWFINGIPSGNNSSVLFTPTEGGSYVVWLEACGNGCCQQSIHSYFTVGNCATGREANHWFFARDSIHLDWNSGVPVEQPASACSSDEAMAIAIDGNGNLIFYSNSERVYNRNNIEMPNGFLINTNRSVTHAITVPLPGSDSLWYMFYPQAYVSGFPDRDTTRKLYMAIVNTKLDNGLGDVILKNQVLLEPTTEKVAAVKHCNGTDWWILGHEAGSNRFFAWLLNKDGLQPPIISSSGKVKSKDRDTKLGEMNFSPDGLKIAMSTGPDILIEPIPMYTIELFDFDPATGIVSGDFVVGEFPLGNGKFAYGLEFSNSSQLLYLAYAASFDTLIQYDLRSGVPSIIRGSRQDIYIAQIALGGTFGAMLTGPDGKIYIANYVKPYLSAIENPDVRGTGCNFVNKAINLIRGESFVGLPTFPAGIYTPGKPWLKGQSIVCDTVEEAKYYVSGNCRYQDYEWKIIGSSEIIRTEGDTIWIKPGNAGMDQLAVIKYTACSTLYDTLDIEILPCDTSTTIPCSIDFSWSEADTLVCAGEDAWLRFYTQADHVRYVLSSEGVSHVLLSSTLVIPHPADDEKVTIYLNTSTGCDTQLVVNIRINPPLDAHFLSADSLVCNGEMAMIDVQTPSSNLVEIFPENLGFVITNPAWPLSVGPLTSDSILYVRIRDQVMGCDSVFKWKIQVETKEKTRRDTLQLCAGDSLMVSGIWFYEDTLLSETFQLRGCDSVHHIQIIQYPALQADIEINDPCKTNNGSISIAPINGSPPFQYAINSGQLQSDPFFKQLGIGNYHLKIIDERGCLYDTIVTLKEINGLSGIENQVMDAHCNENNGTVIVHSGQQNVLFSIGNSIPQMDSVFSGLAAGTYSVISMSPAGCTDTTQVLIAQSGNPSILNITSHPDHCDQNNGILSITDFGGGVPSYTFQLENNPPISIPIFTGLTGGNYTVHITDALGCKDTVSAIVTQEAAPVISSIDIIPAYCGLPEGELSVEAISLSALSFFLDQYQSPDGRFQNLQPGIYQLVVEDTFGCSFTKEIVIPDSISFTIQDIQVTSAGCKEAGGVIEVIASGNNIKITIEELPGEEWTSAIEDLPAGTYHLRLKDIYNCIIDTTVILSSECKISLPNVFSPNGDNINDIFGALPDLQFTFWKLSVFDRGGNMAFLSTDPTKGWNGNHHNKPAQSGVYAWVLEYQLNGDEQKHVEKGDLTLLR